MKVEEVKRRLTRFILLYLVFIIGFGMVEFIITQKIELVGMFIIIGPSVTGLYILNLMAENLFVSTRKEE